MLERVRKTDLVLGIALGAVVGILTDAWHQGWSAKDNDLLTRINLVGGLFRGIELSPGQHHIVFRYEPTTLRMALVASMLALFTLLGIVIAGVMQAISRHTRSSTATRPRPL